MRYKDFKYLTAKKKIISLIHDSGYSIGDRLPPLNELVSILEIGRRPVQEALGLLSEGGFLRTVRGSGCYVKSIPPRLQESTGEMSNFLTGPGSGRLKKNIKILLPSVELECFSSFWNTLFSGIADLRRDVNICLEGIVSEKDLLDLNNVDNADIIMLPSVFLPHFVERGSLFDLEEIGEVNISKKDFYEGVFDSMIYDGKLWGVPAICSSNCLYYNKEYKDIIDAIFPVSGFWDFMEKLDKLPPSLYLNRVEALVSNNHILFDLCCLAFGKDIDTYEDIRDFNSPECRNFIERFGAYYVKKNIFHPKVSVSSLDTVRFFLEGKTAMALGSVGWAYNRLKDSDIDWGILLEPLETNGIYKLNSLIFCISNLSQYPQECLEILDFLGSFECQKCFAQNGRIAARKKASLALPAKYLAPESRANVFCAMVKGRVLRTDNAYLGEYNDTLLTYEMELWRNGVCTGDEFISRLNKKTNFFYRSKKIRKSINENRRRQMDV